jgi:hypothetical protein
MFSKQSTAGHGVKTHSVSFQPSLVWNVLLDTGMTLVSPFQTLFSMILRKSRA